MEIVRAAAWGSSPQRTQRTRRRRRQKGLVQIRNPSSFRPLCPLCPLWLFPGYLRFSGAPGLGTAVWLTVAASRLTPWWVRILASIFLAMSAWSRRNCLAFSRPWPMRSLALLLARHRMHDVGHEIGDGVARRDLDLSFIILGICSLASIFGGLGHHILGASKYILGHSLVKLVYALIYRPYICILSFFHLDKRAHLAPIYLFILPEGHNRRLAVV